MKRVAAEAAQEKPQASSVSSYAGGTLWDSGINKYFVMISSNESLNNSLANRSYSVLDAMAKMPLLILLLSTFAVLNTIIVSVRARRREIGVLRACGVTRYGLIRMVLAESKDVNETIRSRSGLRSDDESHANSTNEWSASQSRLVVTEVFRRN